MSARYNVERILRDDDDASGQTIRQWSMSREGDTIEIRRRADHEGFLLFRVADVPAFVADLQHLATLTPRCQACGQLDEPEIHDAALCPWMGGDPAISGGKT